MTGELVTGVVPVFNGEDYLVEAIESILAQTYGPLELVVVDDGSTDGTPDIVGSYGDEVRYLRQPRSGHAAARNHGIEVARGEFLAFLDADDLWHEEKTARQMARFDARPELELSLGHTQRFWAPELAAEEELYRRHGKLVEPGYGMGAPLIRKSLFERIGVFDATLAHADDTEWFLRAREAGVVTELLPDVVSYRRMHGSSFSRQRASSSLDEYLRLIKTSLDRRRATEGTERR